jgi:hypothetical protein
MCGLIETVNPTKACVALCDSVDQISRFWDTADWLGGYDDWRRLGHLTALREYN